MKIPRSLRNCCLASLLLSAASISYAQPDDTIYGEFYEAAMIYAYEPTAENLALLNGYLKQGLDPVDGHGYGSAFSAAFYNQNVEMVALLLPYAKNLNRSQDSNGIFTPLTAAISSYNGEEPQTSLSMVKLIVEAGADVNYQLTPEHETPLMMAAGVRSSYLQPQLIAYLLDNGANAKTTTSDHFGVLHGLASADLPSLTLLLKQGADPQLVSAAGHSPLHYVCETPTSSFARESDKDAAARVALLSQGVNNLDQFAKLADGEVNGTATALYHSLYSKNPDCTAALVAAGANPQAQAYHDSFIKEVDPSVAGKSTWDLARNKLDDSDPIDARLLKALQP